MAQIETTIYSGGASCSLGRVTLGGRVLDGLGIVLDRPFRTFGSYAVMLVLRGKGHYRDATGALERLEPGSAVLLLPGLSHHYAPDSGTTWDEVYLVFDGPVFDAWRASGILPRPPVVRVEDPRACEARLVALATQEEPALTKLCALQALLADLVQGAVPTEGLGAPEWLRRAKRLLARDLHRPLALKVVAERVGMPYGTFRRRFREATGTSPGEFRENSRVGEAADLLRFTDLTHAAIAQRVGYASEHYLSRRFKAATGLPPRTFRAQAQGQEPPM